MALLVSGLPAIVTHERKTDMTVNELIDRLQALVVEDGYRRDMEVFFGERMEPVEGGIVGNRGGLAVLNLAPVKLDRVGGF